MNTGSFKQKKIIECSMEAAKEWLDARNVRYVQKTVYQLKMGIVNFYPTTGTITIDGEPPYADKGLQALSEALERFGTDLPVCGKAAISLMRLQR